MPRDSDANYERMSCELETPDTFIRLDEAQFAPNSVAYYASRNTEAEFVYTGPLVEDSAAAAPAAREGMIRNLIEWWMSNTDGGRECTSSLGDAMDGDNGVELLNAEIWPYYTPFVDICFYFHWDTTTYERKFFFRYQADVSNAEITCGEITYPFFDVVE